MRFADLIGHREPAGRLVAGVEDGRLPHALLFLGPEGNGALPLALAFAQYVNCETPGGGDSCGKCPACLKADRLIHPDIHFSYPVLTVLTGPKGQQKHKCTDYAAVWRQAVAGDPWMGYTDWIERMQEAIGGSNKQGNIPRDECRDILHKLSLKTYEARHKILVMWLPEYLRKEGNRLLKLIEEPPPGTLFLFVAQDADRILNTIMSRTQIVRVPRYDVESLAAALRERHGAAEDEARRVAELAGGNYRRARAVLADSLAEEEAAFHAWIDAVARWQVLSLFTWNDDFGKLGREGQKNWFGFALHAVRSCCLHGMTDVPDDARLARIAALLDAAGWQAVAEDLGKAQGYIERNANPRIVMLNLGIRTSRKIQEAAMRREGKAAAPSP